MRDFFLNPWVWGTVAVFGFGLCALLPLWVKDEKLRPKIYWFILVPVCLILILYVYTVGLEVFRRWAISP